VDAEQVSEGGLGGAEQRKAFGDPGEFVPVAVGAGFAGHGHPVWPEN
jgi:hypothetical protein